jgi:hypothetical protein
VHDVARSPTLSLAGFARPNIVGRDVIVVPVDQDRFMKRQHHHVVQIKPIDHFSRACEFTDLGEEAVLVTPHAICLQSIASSGGLGIALFLSGHFFFQRV